MLWKENLHTMATQLFVMQLFAGCNRIPAITTVAVLNLNNCFIKIKTVKHLLYYTCLSNGSSSAWILKKPSHV